jgi:Domain of unknown function (DUF4440)
MKVLFSLIVAGLLTASAFAQTPATPADATALTNSVLKAMGEEDGAAVTTLTTDDFTITGFTGQQADRDLLVQGLNGGFLVFETATASGVQARTYNADAAAVTGTWTVKGNLQGKEFKGDAAFSATCVKVAGAWKMASFQMTLVQ